MAVSSYEGMFLVDSARFATDNDGVTKHILGILEKAGARLVSHRPWQDGRLAYSVDGHRKGLHYLVYFELDTQKLTEVVRACKLSETILRQIIIRQPKVLFDAMVQALASHTTQAPPEEPPRGRPMEDSDDRPRRGRSAPRRDRPPELEPEEAEVGVDATEV